MDSLNQHKDLREEVKKLVYKEQLYEKVRQENTFNILLNSRYSTSLDATNGNAEFKVQMPNLPNGHIRNAKCRLLYVQLSSAIDDLIQIPNVAVDCSLLKINHFVNRDNAGDDPSLQGYKSFGVLPLRADHKSTPATAAAGDPTTIIVSDSATAVPAAAVGAMTRSYLVDKSEWFACDNPSGQSIDIRLYNPFNYVGLPLDNVLGQETYVSIEVQLLPDFNENDRQLN